MPVKRVFRGQEVKHTRRISVNGSEMIKITLVGPKMRPGKQIVVTPVEYEAEIEKTFYHNVSQAACPSTA